MKEKKKMKEIEEKFDSDLEINQLHDEFVERVVNKLPRGPKSGKIEVASLNLPSILAQIFREDPALKFNLDELSGQIMREPYLSEEYLEAVTHGLPDDRSKKEWRDPKRAGKPVDLDIEANSLAAFIGDSYKIPFNTSGKIALLISCLKTAAADRAFNPLTDRLDELGDQWDHTPRIGSLFTEIFGAPATKATEAVAYNFFIGAVERAYNPGCKKDECLVLSGAQGAGKSTFFRKISDILPDRDLFTDGLTFAHMKDTKAATEIIQGKWIVELSEMTGLSKTEVTTVKAYISSQTDRYRRAYDRDAHDHPRRFVIGMSSNEERFLYDTTGNRRFLVVYCKEDKERSIERIYSLLTPEYVEQIWGEAVTLYREGKKSFIDPGSEEWKDIEQIQTEAMKVSDTLLAQVLAYMDTEFPVTLLMKQLGRDRRTEHIKQIMNGESVHEWATDKHGVYDGIPTIKPGAFYGTAGVDYIFKPVLLADLGLDESKNGPEIARILKMIGFEQDRNHKVRITGQIIAKRDRPYMKTATDTEDRIKAQNAVKPYVEGNFSGIKDNSLPFCDDGDKEITEQIKEDFGI